MNVIKFAKSYSSRVDTLYWVTIDGIPMGSVYRSGRAWENSKTDTRYVTRREAAEAMRPFIAAEAAAQEHFTNATSVNPRIAAYDSPVYVASQTALKNAIKATYPDMDAERVYDVWVDCGESIYYCVEHLRKEARELAEYEAELAAEAAALAVEQANRTAFIHVSGDTLTLIAVYPEADKAPSFEGLYTRLGTPLVRASSTGDFDRLVNQANLMAEEFGRWTTAGHEWTVSRHITFPTPVGATEQPFWDSTKDLRHTL